MQRLLEKDRDLRYQSAADLRAELRRLKRDTESGRSAAVGAPLTTPKTPPRTNWRRLALLGGSIAVILAALAFGWYKLRREPSGVATEPAERQLTANSRKTR